VLSSSKKTTASLLLLALFSSKRFGCVFLMRSVSLSSLFVVFFFFRDMIRCFLTVVPLRVKKNGRTVKTKKKKKKEKNTDDKN